MDADPTPPVRRGLRERTHEVIFEADTPAGRLFDIALLIAIVLSVIVVCLESVPEIRAVHADLLISIEWVFTILFTIEYVLRLWCVGRPLKYATSFFGVIDLLSIIPTWAGIAIGRGRSLTLVRALRLLRIFRVLKLGHFLGEAERMRAAMRSSARKIIVFLGVVLTLVLLVGALMYVIESGADSGFTSIPRSMYWAIVTLTTVGYGDVAPVTPLGQFLASCVMILGYGIIAVPTGIVSVELATSRRKIRISTKSCQQCSSEGHDPDAKYCKDCGALL
jgi:voltage-gated potassium channel